MSNQAEDPREGLPSASKLERICACPGSEALCRTVPPEVEELGDDDDLAARGTRIHKARETGNTLPLDPEEVRLYENGLKCEAKLLEKWKETFGLTEVREGPRELRLWLHDLSYEPIGSGQLDVHFLAAKRAIVIDWKSLYCTNLVGARGNWQLRAQAVLLWLEMPGLEEIRVAFAKPMYEKAPLDFCDYTAQDLKYSHESILYQLWWATQPDAGRHPGKHCRYCPALNGYCPEALAYSLLPSVIGKQVFGKRSMQADVSEVAPADLLKLWRMGPIIRKTLDGVSKRLKSMTEQELTDLGLVLGDGRKNQNITGVKACFEFLRDTKGWPEADVWACLAFVNGKIKEHMELREGMSEKQSGEWLKETLKEFITVTETDKIIKEL